MGELVAEACAGCVGGGLRESQLSWDAVLFWETYVVRVCETQARGGVVVGEGGGGDVRGCAVAVACHVDSSAGWTDGKVYV